MKWVLNKKLKIKSFSESICDLLNNIVIIWLIYYTKEKGRSEGRAWEDIPAYFKSSMYERNKKYQEKQKAKNSKKIMNKK